MVLYCIIDRLYLKRHIGINVILIFSFQDIVLIYIVKKYRGDCRLSIFDILTLAGGVGMFLYGITIMSDGLEKTAGAKLEKTIETWTGNVIKGVLVGMLVTAVIQSSTATTVMVVGFVNAGVMKLSQSVGVIMGANIGTTVTAQILRLSGISSDNVWLNLLKPSSFAPVLIVIGVIMIMFSKKNKIKNISMILIGLGILFMGMGTMETAVSPLRDNEAFARIFTLFKNPVAGVGAGAVATVIIQSSSASVGILQALAKTGIITFSAVFPIIMGQNIGTCLTAIVSGLGGNKNARRASMIHLYFNLIGTILFLTVFYSYQYFIGFPFWNDTVNSGNIADFHLIFNVSTTIVLIPFYKLILKLATITVKSDDNENEEVSYLDDHFLSTPAIAVEQSRKAVKEMSKITAENLRYSKEFLFGIDKKLFVNFSENEEKLDKLETAVENYLVKVSENEAASDFNFEISELLHCSDDFERAGDNLVNIFELIERTKDDVKLTDDAIKEIEGMFKAVEEITELTNESFVSHNIENVIRIEALEETIDNMKRMFKAKHIDRLKLGKCNAESGILFLDIIANLERVADHCSDIVMHVVRFETKNENFNHHTYIRELHNGNDVNYGNLLREYEDKYIVKA